MSKKVNESLIEAIINDENVLSEMLKNLLSKKNSIRFKSFNTLLHLSEGHPEVLYPHWDFFVELINSNNTYLKYEGIYLIANLTRIDTKLKFENIFENFYNLLDDKSVVTASHLAGNSGKIARAKPNLQTKITNKLLNIDKTHHKQQRKDLIKSYIIEALNEYFDDSKNKKMIIEFVKDQLTCTSPKTRKKAKEFLKKTKSIFK